MTGLSSGSPLLLVVLLLAGTATAQTEGDREASMFGEAPTGTSTTTTTTTAPSREAELFGETAPSGEVPAGVFDATPPGLLDSKLESVRDYLDIGGFLWLRGQYSAVDSSNPETFPVILPNFSDLYLDARPNDHLRTYVRGRLRYDPTIDEAVPGAFGTTQDQIQVQLDQLWMKFDIARRAFVTLGKQRTKWGVGRFWNPTDFLNYQVLDPLSGVVLFDEHLGVSMLKLHVPVESLGWNFYGYLTTDLADSPDKVGGALRAEILLAETELTLSMYGRKDSIFALGGTVSTGLWLFDLKAEVAVTHNSQQIYLVGSCALNSFVQGVNDGSISVGPDFDPTSAEYAEYFGESVDRSDEWIPQVVLGGELGLSYGDDDAVYVGAEYFYNHRGYADESLYACLATRGSFTPFYLGQHYGAAYVLFPAPGDWNDTTFVISSISNLSDLSAVARFDYTVTVLTYLSINAYFQGHLGQAGDEFSFATSLIPIDPTVVPPALIQDPRARLLSQGLVIPKPLFEVGFGLRLNY